jgi:GNAT superfamily N-acetyltransferase
MHIEPFIKDQTSYEQLVEVHNACWPDGANTAEEWQHADANRKPGLFIERYVAIVDGRIVAWGTCGQQPWSHQDGKFGLYGGVHPDCRHMGIGKALFDKVFGVAVEQGATKLTAETREDQTDAIRFLENRGFSRLMRYPISELDSGRFQANGFQPKLDHVREGGIAIKTLATLQQEDPDWQQKAYELETVLAEDVPSTDPLTPIGFDFYVKNVLENPAFLPDAYFVALDGDHYVGMSNLYRDLTNPQKLNTGLTGVLRSHRRRGIATALKVHGIRYAQAYGNAVIETGNEENNPMYQLNLQLGYRPKPAWMDYVRILDNQG